VPEVLEHPEFALAKDLAARCGDEMLRLLRADAALSGYFLEIVPCELEDLVVNAAGNTPLLAVLIPETDSVVIANADTGELRVVLELLMLHQLPKAKSNARWLRSRIVAHIKRLIWASGKGGQLFEGGDEDVPLTEALTRFGRVPFAYRFTAGVVATPIRIEFRSWENLATGGLA